jgi:quinolinate synthase
MTTTPELDLLPGVEPSPLALLLLGRQRDLASERGVDCPGDLPSASDPGLVERARAPRRPWATGSSCWATTTSATR